MRGMVYSFVGISLWSMVYLVCQVKPPEANSKDRFVPVPGPASGEDFIYLNGEPFVLVGIRPRGDTHRIQLCDKQGRVAWTHRLGEEEQLGQARLSPDGKYLVYDYFVVETSRGWIAPHERVPYRGGIRCVRRDGSIAWEIPSRGVCEGAPVYSPEGAVEQVVSNRILILKHSWESLVRATVRDFAGRRLLTVDLSAPTTSATTAALFPDGSHLVVSKQTGDPDEVWVRLMRVDGGIVWHIVGARLPGYDPVEWFHPPHSYMLLEVCSWQHFLRSLRHESQPVPKHETRVREDSRDGHLALITREGKLVWTGRWRFDTEKEPVPILQDEGKDVSWGAANWDEYRQMMAQRGSQVTILWNRGSHRRLLTLDSPGRGRGALVLQRVAALSAARPHEKSVLSPDGRLVAIYRISRNGNTGMLHVHFWNRSGRLISEAVMPGLPLDDSGIPGYPDKVWISADNRYLVVWIRSDASHSDGYCVVQIAPSDLP
ncbi:MAG: hypothetical protein KatS3mg023_3108 [Armatimonadota bacterium]|nr:MAG: hypothetical protein KatS3mg023_3108 [Armatimonadota bacterium]